MQILCVKWFELYLTFVPVLVSEIPISVTPISVTPISVTLDSGQVSKRVEIIIDSLDTELWKVINKRQIQ